MKRILFLIALLLCLSSTIADAESNIKDYYTYLTAEQAYDVHAEASLTSPVVSKIKPGDAVFIADQGPNVGDSYNPIAWYKVTHGPDGTAGDGYILTGTFLQDNSLIHGATRFVCERKFDKKHHLVTITFKAFDKKGRLLAASEPVTTIDALHQLQIVANRGLSDVQFMILFSTSYDACGTPNCVYYYAWTGSDLALLPSSNRLEADVPVAYNEKLIFPDEGALSDTIIKEVTASESFDDDDDDEAAFHVKGKEYAMQIYVWDGKRVVLQSPEPKLFDWFQDYLEDYHYKYYDDDDNSNDTTMPTATAWIQRINKVFTTCRLRIARIFLPFRAWLQ